MRYGGLPDTHGLLRNIQAGDLQPGSTSDTTASTHQRWRLLATHCTYFTPLAGSTRRLRLEIRAGTTTLLAIDARQTQIAGQTRSYNFAPQITDRTAFAANTLTTPTARQLLISPGQTIRLTVANPQPDDEMTEIFHLVEEWIDG